jgi:hypothetical protein
MGFVASVCQPSTLRMLICPEASSAQNNIAAQRAAKLIYICRTPRERERQTLGTGADVQPLSGRSSGRELGWAGPRTVLHPAARGLVARSNALPTPRCIGIQSSSA